MNIKEETKQAWRELAEDWLEALEETGRLNNEPEWL